MIACGPRRGCRFAEKGKRLRCDPAKSIWIYGDRYRQLVKDQYYPYIRPQESGTKSDIRWWKLTDIDGRGLAIRSDVPFSASALNYLPEDLDDGWDKDQRHSGELKPRGLTTLSFDLKQMGLGCINSWGAWPLQPYLLPYQDYTFQVVITPIRKY